MKSHKGNQGWTAKTPGRREMQEGGLTVTASLFPWGQVSILKVRRTDSADGGCPELRQCWWNAERGPELRATVQSACEGPEQVNSRGSPAFGAALLPGHLPFLSCECAKQGAEKQAKTSWLEATTLSRYFGCLTILGREKWEFGSPKWSRWSAHIVICLPEEY